MTNYEKRTILANEMATWVGADLTQEQIDSAIWAIAHIQRNCPEMIEDACKEVYLDIEGEFPIEEDN